MGGLTFDGVVFDADGTLFDTENLMYEVWVEVGEEMNFPYPGREYLDYVGLNRAAVLALMRERYGEDFDGAEFMVRCVDRLSQRIEGEGVPLKPGVQEILAFLREKNIPVGLATSTHRVRTDRRLELCGLKDCFQAVTTGDEVSKGKPDPEIYLATCGKLGLDPARCLAVEDSKNGILSAKAAGMSVAMIPDMIPPSEELLAQVWGRFDSLIDLQNCLK